MNHNAEEPLCGSIRQNEEQVHTGEGGQLLNLSGEGNISKVIEVIETRKATLWIRSANRISLIGSKSRL